MKIIEINSRENANTATWDYLIVIFGLIKLRRVLYQEQVVTDNYPFWFKASKWLLQNTCFHCLEKTGKEYLEGYFLGDYNTFLQDWKCTICEKKLTSQRYGEV